MNYTGLIEEALKSAIYQDFFSEYKYTQLGRIDFVIAARNAEDKNAMLFSDGEVLKSILWAEAKQGTSHDIYESFVQLILTIGKERTFEKYLPPKYIGAFDAEKFAFIEYHDIQHIFYQNDFNWNVTPSNHGTKEFKLLVALTKELLEKSAMCFFYEKQAKELKDFVKTNFLNFSDITEKIAVTKNNFIHVFNQWLSAVKPTIDVDWSRVNKKGIISADFFLADLLSENNESLKENLFVVLQKTKYELARKIDEETGLFDSKKVGFSDGQKAHRAFWAIYERPPKEEYWSYIIERRDLLVPQDIRERKGSFFTPKKWVELSQKYLADVLGENWQDEYYIWDCCAGTGNLLNGLVNPRNVWASTLDKADVDVMKDRIANGWTMFENHVFQFDFLNDDFAPQDLTPRPPLQSGEGVAQSAQKLPSPARRGAGGEVKGKLPNELYEIISDEEKRKKLVIYINPPYAEGDSRIGKGRSGVAVSKVQEKYSTAMGYSKRELYIQFMARIYAELFGCKLGVFSTLTHLQGSKFFAIRDSFLAKLEKIFLVPANTFDNVKGEFPIGFQVWNSEKVEKFQNTEADLYDTEGSFIGAKTLFSYENCKYINDWTLDFIETDKKKEKENSIANIIGVSNDFQHQSTVCIENPNKPWNHQYQWQITKDNLIQSCIYYAVRKVIEHSWINHNDQFLYPSDDWANDKEFQLDCLVYTLFGDKNRITSVGSIVKNSLWLPFTENEVGSKKAFASDFMAKFLRDFMAGKISADKPQPPVPLLLEGEGGELATISNDAQNLPSPARRGAGVRFSVQAAAVYSAGLELWRYYFKTAGDSVNENASFYDIRKYFQGVDGKGRMNNKSDNVEYNQRIETLRNAQKKLAAKIAEKVYEYGFLR